MPPGLSPVHLMVILAVALIVLGPEKLPDAARRVGRLIAQAREVSSRFSAEVQSALSVGAPDTPPDSASPGSTPPSTLPGPASDGSAAQPSTTEEHQ